MVRLEHLTITYNSDKLLKYHFKKKLGGVMKRVGSKKNSLSINFEGTECEAKPAEE